MPSQIVLPFNLGDTLYKGFCERRGGEPGVSETVDDSLPTVEEITVDRIDTTTTQDDYGNEQVEVRVMSSKHGLPNGRTEYFRDDKRPASLYQYGLYTKRADAEARAKNDYKTLTGKDFAGTVRSI